MTLRHKILAACAVAAVLTTAVTAQALAQTLAPGGDLPAVTQHDAAGADTAPTAAEQAAADQAARDTALTDLGETLAGLLGGATTDYSVAAYDGTTATTYVDGAGAGMYTASIVKVEILAALLLQHQDAGTALTDAQRRLATLMIEQSDNDAASTLWTAIGGDEGLNAASARLGLTSTVGGEDGYWGLTTTSALDQMTLLDSLTAADSVLTASSQATLVELMGAVAPDQAWGVTAAADAGTTSAVKNGWLALSADDGLWVVNSIGLVDVAGSTVQVAVMLRGLSDFDDGVALVESIASATADSLASLRDQLAPSAT